MRSAASALCAISFFFFVERFSLSLREGMSPAACDFSFCFAMCLLLSLAVNILFCGVHCSASVGAYGLIIAGLSRLPFSFFCLSSPAVVSHATAALLLTLFCLWMRVLEVEVLSMAGERREKEVEAIFRLLFFFCNTKAI